MAYLDRVLLDNVEPFEHEIIISEDIDNFLLKEGFVPNYSGVKPRFWRNVSDPDKLHCYLLLDIYEDHCHCAVNHTRTHDFRFDKNDYQNFISHYTLLINKLAEYYKK